MNSEPSMTVAISIPSYDRWTAEFGQSLANLLLYVSPETEQRVAIIVHAVMSTYLPQARQMLVRQALAAQAQKILWLDTDMEFPKDKLYQLLARDKDIVGANYRCRRPPHRFV